VIRLATVVVIIVVLVSPAVAQQQSSAQNMALTVSVQSAAVRMSPSTGSPVVGQAVRGTVLEVTRDIGAWVKVTWPGAPDGIGYVHQSMGTLSNRPSREQRMATAMASLPPPEPGDVPAGQASIRDEVTAVTRAMYVPPPTHRVGLGGHMTAANPGFGFSSRIWSRNRIGVQVDLSRTRLSNDFSTDRVRTTEFAPSVIYSFNDYVTENFWLRPYAGGGPAWVRSKLSFATSDPSTSLSDSKLGWRAFGGAEVTVPGVPRLAISADFGYQWIDQSFDGFDPAGPRFSISGHWYVW
jgi:opacity protein-like surface antigen